MRSCGERQSCWMFATAFRVSGFITYASQDVHDEVISLNLQLNLSDQRLNALKAENKDLIDRWMARKGREAEDMNNQLTKG